MKNLLLMIGFLGLLPTANAYIPPATYILNRIVQSHEHFKTIELDGVVTDLRTHQIFREVARIDFLSGKIQLMYLNETGSVIGDGHVKLNEIHPYGLAWYGVGLDSNAARVRGDLQALGITIKDEMGSKLTRLVGRPVWDIGETAILRVEKDQFAFAGLMENSNNEIQVLEFTGGGIPLPRILKFKKDGTDLFSYEMKSFRINIPYKSSFFASHAISLSGGASSDSSSIVGQATTQEWSSLVH